MARLPKFTYQSFVQDWNGRKGWAEQNNIPFNDFSQAVKFDYNRLINTGFKMRDTEAFDALSALKTGKNPFQTPADTAPSFFSDPFGAIRHDVQGIVTGLFHFPQVIGHDVTEAIHGHFGPIAQLIPGYTDITDLFSSQGRKYLTEHPVSDLLDIGGIGRIAELGSSALRSMGAEEAANALKLIPDHPVSRILAGGFNKAADNIASVARLRDIGFDTLGHLGVDAGQKDFILRPSVAYQDLIKNMPWLQSYDMIKEVKFGKYVGGIQIDKQLSNMLKDVPPEDIQAAVDMTKGMRDGQPYPVSQWLDDPTVSQASKTLYKGFVDAATNLRSVQWLEMHAIKPVINPKTGEIGWVKANGSDWERYEMRLNRTLRKAQRARSDLSGTINKIFTSLQKIRNEDSGAPASLRRSPDESPLNIITSLRRAAEYYRLHAEDVFRHPRYTTEEGTSLTTKGGKDAFRNFNKAVQRIFGEGGPVDRLTANIGSLKQVGDVDAIAADIKSIQRSLSKLHMRQDDVYHWMNGVLDDVQKASDDLHNSWLDIGSLKKNYDQMSKREQVVSRNLDLSWSKYTQQEFRSLAQQHAYQHVWDYFTEHYILPGEVRVTPPRGKNPGIEVNGETIAKVQEDILSHNWDSAELKILIPDSLRTQWENDAWRAMDDLRRQGVKPIFLTAYREKELTSKGRFPTTGGNISTYEKSSVRHERQSLFSPSKFDPRISIPKEMIGIYRTKLKKALIDDFFFERTISKDDFYQMSKSFWHKKVPGFKRGEHPEYDNIDDQMAHYAKLHGYKSWDPNDPFNPDPPRVHGSDTQRWIKEYDLKLMTKSVSMADTEINRWYNSAMKAYRFGVLIASPRYAAHIILTGAVLTELRLVHPIISPIKYMGEVMRRVKQEHDSLPSYVTKGVSEQDPHGELLGSPFELHNKLAGNKLGEFLLGGRMARTGETRAVAAINAYKHILESFSNGYRVLALLDKKASVTAEELADPHNIAMAKKWNTPIHEWIAGQAANKVLADMMTLSPIERTVIMRYIMPFWGWTRHIMRYMATYPIDHPLRASMLQTIANQAIGQESFLPEYLFRLLFLGQPNAQGNVTVLDTRQWNPFRDTANYMTWGGIMAQLNPIWAAVGVSAFGMNPATGQANLYPQLTYDSFYGTNTSAPSGNFFENLAKQFSPQLNTLIDVMTRNSALRQQASQNPSKLGYLIADSIGVPWVPYTYNVKQERIHTMMAEYKDVSKAVQEALLTNSMAPLEGFSGLLPLQGYEVNKNYIAELINNALREGKQLKQNIPATDLIQLPYASAYNPEFLLAGKNNQ